MTDQQEVPYVLSTLGDLEWSIRTWLQKRRIFGANTKLSMKIDPYVSGKMGDEPEWSSENG